MRESLSKEPLPQYLTPRCSDQVVLIRPRKAVFVAVDPSGVPVDEEGKITAILQTRVATKAGRNARQDYCMVHLPPFYRARFWIFAVTLWTGVAWACVGSMLAILVLGRWMTGLWFKGPVHDGYSLVSLCACPTGYRKLIHAAFL